MDEFEAMIDGLDQRAFRAMAEFMLGGRGGKRRGKGEQRSAAARAFGVAGAFDSAGARLGWADLLPDAEIRRLRAEALTGRSARPGCRRFADYCNSK